MSISPQALLTRLDEIGRSLERSGHALALIGLGSVGLERERLDAYSDLDFFAVVEPGHKPAYLEDLGWLAAVCPIAFCFRNTVDGFKLLFADGVFAEFAVFTPDELATVPFAPGRLVWRRVGVPEDLGLPAKERAGPARREPDWLLGEALTNLYVGLGRERRGERLSATRFIQGYAVDRVLELVETLEGTAAAARDPFAPDRRFEQRYPAAARHLPGWVGGYARNRESALAILAFLEEHVDVNGAMAGEIRRLAAPDDGSGLHGGEVTP